MSDKLVSVCINAYNAEKFILKTIDSIINQTYKNLQIIIVDDCSTDNTYNIVKSIDDPRIEIHQTQLNGHMSFACNEALKHVKGEYVAHLDADDLWTTDKIEKQVKFLEENTQYGACFTHAEIIDEENDIADQKFDFMREMFAFKNRSHAEMYRFFYENSNKLCHSSALVKTEFIKKVGNYDVSTLFLQDFGYWMQLITYAPIYIFPEKLVLYRCGGNSNDMSSENWIAYNNEAVRIIYNSLNLCPNKLFLEAFADKLKFDGSHTEEEIEIEKAFVLLEGPFPYKNNPILGLLKFKELFKEEKYVKIASEKFNFTTRDLYKIQQSACFVDVGERNHLVASVNKYEIELNDLKNHTKNLEDTVSNHQTEAEKCHKYIKDLEKTNADSNNHINNLENNISDLNNHIVNLENYVKDLEKNNSSQSDYIFTLEGILASTKFQLTEMTNAYNKIRSNFVVRIMFFIKRLFTKK